MVYKFTNLHMWKAKLKIVIRKTTDALKWCKVYADFKSYIKLNNNILYNKVYPGPTDGTAKITSIFTEPIATRYIRIRPVQWLVKAYFGHSHWMSLRMELLGCKGKNFKFGKYSFLRFGLKGRQNVPKVAWGKPFCLRKQTKKKPKTKQNKNKNKQKIPYNIKRKGDFRYTWYKKTSEFAGLCISLRPF